MIYLNAIKTTFLDFPNDTDISIIAFFEGCCHNCIGCQNEHLKIQTHSYDREDVLSLITANAKRHNTDKIVFSGGDPFFKDNLDSLEDMLYIIDRLENEGYELCVYTGYTLDNIYDIYKDKNYRMPSYVKCGVFVESNKRLSEKTDYSFTLSSPNQDFYKLNKDVYHKISEKGVLLF